MVNLVVRIHFEILGLLRKLGRIVDHERLLPRVRERRGIIRRLLQLETTQLVLVNIPRIAVVHFAAMDLFLFLLCLEDAYDIMLFLRGFHGANQSRVLVSH